jgi:hypothetical protein
MTATPAIGISVVAANQILGRKLEGISFSAYHVLLIAVLGFVGFADGYDLAVTCWLLVLASRLLFDRETVGQLKAFTEAISEPG